MTIDVPERESAPAVAALLGEKPYMLGDVVSREAVDAVSLGVPVELQPGGVFTATVADPYLTAFTPEEFARVKDVESATAQLARTRREAGLWQRRKGTAYVDADGHGHATSRGGILSPARHSSTRRSTVPVCTPGAG